MISAGGVQQLVQLVGAGHPNPQVARYALSALAQLADHPAAQEAIRWGRAATCECVCACGGGTLRARGRRCMYMLRTGCILYGLCV